MDAAIQAVRDVSDKYRIICVLDSALEVECELIIQGHKEPVAEETLMSWADSHNFKVDTHSTLTGGHIWRTVRVYIPNHPGIIVATKGSEMVQ